MTEQYPSPARRLLITIPAILATTMVAIDMTIANVALPHMQSSLSASSDQVVWVLTSYLIAGAIATPLSSWLANRFGRKWVMIFSVGGFTAASVLCGAATGLTMILVARALQGACGAALMPLSQAILLDINPPENHGKAMGIFSLGSMAGPLIGPTLGGWLTDSLSWRWVFYINVPFGIFALVGMLAFLPGRGSGPRMRFDMFGFLALSAGLAAFQLMMDRGEQLDWFDSTEIWVYATILGLSLYLTIVHMLTARGTFIRPELFRDRNFAIGSVFSVLIGMVAFAVIPLLTILMQNLLGYDAFLAGMISMPRAVGTTVALLTVTRLINRIDNRAIIFTGLVLLAVSLHLYTKIDLYVDESTLIWIGLLQGFGSGMIFMPMSLIMFTTLSSSLRNEGAAMSALMRNMGNAIGLSLLQRQLIHSTASTRSYLTEGLRPDNPIVQMNRPDLDLNSSSSVAGLSHEVARQAAMVGNIEVVKISFILAISLLPLIIFFRTARTTISSPIPFTE